MIIISTPQSYQKGFIFVNHLVRCLAHVNLLMTVSSYFFYFHSLICKTAFLLSHLKAGFYCIPDTHIHACVLSCLVVSDCLRPCILQSPRILCPWNFSRQEYWSELPFPSPGDLLDPGIEPESVASPALAGGFLPLCHLGS